MGSFGTVPTPSLVQPPKWLVVSLVLGVFLLPDFWSEIRSPFLESPGNFFGSESLYSS